MKNYFILITVLVVATLSSCQKEHSNPGLTGKQITNGRHMDGVPVTIAQVSPSSGIVYSAVKITGTNFSPIAAENTVKINGVTAIINSATSTEIVATIAKSSSTGKITVTTGGSTATSASDFKVLQMVKEITFPIKLLSAYVFETLTQLRIAGFAFDKTGNGTIYAHDTKHVFKFTPDGKTTLIYTVPKDEIISYPDDNPDNAPFFIQSMATGRDGNIYIGIYNQDVLYAGVQRAKLVKITPQGQSAVIAGNGINSQYYHNTDGKLDSALFLFITDIEINDVDNNMYIMDGNCLRKITPSGMVSTLISAPHNPGYITSQFDRIVSDNVGNIFLTRTTYAQDYAAKIQKMDLQGNITDIAGKSTQTGFTYNIDGQGLEAGFNRIQDLEIDGANNIYALSSPLYYYDPHNNIRLINTAGYVSTFAPQVDTTFQIGVDKKNNKIYIATSKAITRYGFK